MLEDDSSPEPLASQPSGPCKQQRNKGLQTLFKLLPPSPAQLLDPECKGTGRLAGWQVGSSASLHQVLDGAALLLLLKVLHCILNPLAGATSLGSVEMSLLRNTGCSANLEVSANCFVPSGAVRMTRSWTMTSAGKTPQSIRPVHEAEPPCEPAGRRASSKFPGCDSFAFVGRLS